MGRESGLSERHGVIGRELGNVVIVRELGRGAMGAVYIGYQKTLKRRVAVKLLQKTDETTEQSRRQFREEAETVAILSHPYIVPIFEMGEDEEYFYQVMQLINGVDLKTLIRKKARHPVPSRRLITKHTAVRLVTMLLEGLGYAHKKGVVHQDIKPANVMVEQETKRPMIVDFGIAKTARAEYWAQGLVVGSALYLAPEQAAGEETDGRSDIYSMGLCLFETIAGFLPIRSGEDENQLFVRKLRQPDTVLLKPPSRCTSNVDPELEEIILKAVAADPADRYASCEAFRSALLKWSGHDHEHR